MDRNVVYSDSPQPGHLPTIQDPGKEAYEQSRDPGAFEAHYADRKLHIAHRARHRWVRHEDVIRIVHE